jgi:hypothetical protein
MCFAQHKTKDLCILSFHFGFSPCDAHGVSKMMSTRLYKNGMYTRAELSVFKKPKENFLQGAL